MLTWRELSQSALEHNLAIIQQYLIPNTQICACIKGDGYGHGLVEIAQILDQYLDWFAVFTFTEFQQLIEAGVTAHILVLGRIEDKDLEYVIRHQGRLYGYSQEYVTVIHSKAQRLGVSAFLHVPIETGMGRLGLYHKHAPEILQDWNSWPSVIIEGVVQHFATADEDEYVYYQAQQELFYQTLDQLQDLSIPYVHADNSASIIDHGQTGYTNIVRVGASVYGFSPSEDVDETLRENNTLLQPVLAWKTQVISVKNLPEGHGVSYGGRKLSRNTQVAVLPIGYADGYDRRLSEKGYVLIQGQKCPILGMICMNMTMVDVTHMEVGVGEEVVLIGMQGDRQITVEDLAFFMDTIPYEVLTHIQTPDIIWKK